MTLFPAIALWNVFDEFSGSTAIFKYFENFHSDGMLDVEIVEFHDFEYSHTLSNLSKFHNSTICFGREVVWGSSNVFY